MDQQYAQQPNKPPLYPQFQPPSPPSQNPQFSQSQHQPSFPSSQQQPWFDNPSSVSFGPESAIAHFGLDYGKQMFGRSQSFISSYLVTLKYYFNVNNSYVVNKLKLLLFPLRHKSWKRRVSRQGDSNYYLPPREDINAPDLYLPLMAFITYVLIIGFAMGTTFKFTPEVLGVTASSGVMAIAFEVLLIKLGFYLLNAASVPIFDLLAYCGYKFVGVVLTVLTGFIFGQWPFYGVLLFTGICMFYFMIKTLRDPFSIGDGEQHTSKRNYFLVGIGLLQPLLCYYLAYDTPLLSEVPMTV